MRMSRRAPAGRRSSSARARPIRSPSTTDGNVYLDEELNCLINRYGRAAEGGIAAYALDNEPALWPYTHALLHPVKPTCAEIVERGAAVAAMVKDMDGGAEVYGPVLYGWSAFMNFQDAADWTNALSSQYYWFVSYYLEKMKEVSGTDGRRLLDVLDLHYYPEVYANNSSGSSTRITGNDSSGSLAAARMQATRSLWDETYDEASWITGWIGEPVKLVPRLKESIAQYYPGTKMGLSEYCFGGINDYSGGIAQADALGIFGKSGVYAACYWGEVGGYIAPAFRIFRNYDGENSTFGDLSLATNAPDAASYSLYASRESGTGVLHLVAINKTASAEVANVSLAGGARVVTSARVFGFSEAGGAVLSELAPVSSISGNAFSYSLPAHSVLHFVFADPDVTGLRAEQDVGASLVHLYFRTTPGATYRLQSGTNLADWSNVDETTYEGDGGCSS
jgi:mannan endo-1,4-beta-mannosidase